MGTRTGIFHKVIKSAECRCRGIVFRVIVGMGVLYFAGCEPEVEPVEEVPSPSPSPQPSPVTAIPPPKPTPLPTVARKPMDLSQLFSGVTYMQKFSNPSTEALASTERTDPTSYVVEVKVTVRKPRASSTAEDFAANDPELAAILTSIPGFPDNATVSTAFDRLYELKADWIKDRVSNLEQILSRHNYYDCESILEFTIPGSGRRMLLLKGDMDVNVDGSDGDRNVEIDGSSRFFQPQTSYRWKKATSRPNPFLAKTENRLAELKAEYAVKGLPAKRNQELKEGIEMLSRRVYDLKTWSFLISSTDPSIVLPGFMLRSSEEKPAYASIGDYAVVIYKGVAYPAVVGDAGPSFKFGEASLRICRELNAKSSANARPVSALNVAYLVFPGSADPAGPPDLDRWYDRCAKLLKEAGLENVSLHRWENLVPPWPTPTPSPTPDPSPAPETGAVVEPTPVGTPAGSEPAAEATPATSPSETPASTPEPSPEPPTPSTSPS